MERKDLKPKSQNSMITSDACGRISSNSQQRSKERNTVAGICHKRESDIIAVPTIRGARISGPLELVRGRVTARQQTLCRTSSFILPDVAPPPADDS